MLVTVLLGSSTIGGLCDVDGDCKGHGVTCILGKCQCHYSYAQKTDAHSAYQVCVKAPDTVGAPCSDTCRFPLFCNNNRCQCIRSKKEGNQYSYLGQPCKRHIECSIPFSACINSQCGCVQGSSRRGNSCDAEAHCPNGQKAGRPCTIRTLDVDVIHNVINSGSILDDCQPGYFCHAPPMSFTGHCCALTCPFAIQPSTEYSCDARDEHGRPCPSETHYCHRFCTGPSFSYHICCRSPCKEPKPLYIHATCYARAFLGKDCQLNEQCDGATTMECSGGKCACKYGFKPESTEHTSIPPMTCVPSQCSRQGALVGYDCIEKANLGEQCVTSVQCPSRAYCFRGICHCQCGFAKQGNQCVPNQQTGTYDNDDRLLKGVRGGGGGGVSIMA
ncbi:EB module family protein [Trichuris trichiura]|uniref:EB module family protein n=1 Tax=Trichuris trichiura TaxID=36087 RepID=A0A077Z4P4_TRITR|nr:EB module family protein [Trichuris trichiura]